MPSYYSRDPQDDKEVPQRFIEEAKVDIRDDILNCLPATLHCSTTKQREAVMKCLEAMLDEMDLQDRAWELYAEYQENEACEKADRDREEMKERERIGY